MCSKCKWIKSPTDYQEYTMTYVSGKTQEQHDKHLLQLTKTAEKQGLIFNSNKCHISQPQITFYRTIYSVQGMKPDSIKIQALQDFPTPQTQKTATIIPQNSELPPTLLTRHSQQNSISLRTSFTMGLEPLNRQLYPEVKAMYM